MEETIKQRHQLAAQVVELAIKQKVTIATAESVTGGLLSSSLTDIPGSSQVFYGGMVCYQNRAKNKLLTIPKSLLEVSGAVSEEVTSLLATNLSQMATCDLNIAVTGVAGPDRDAQQQPVGTLFMAIKSPLKCETHTQKLPLQERCDLKEQFAIYALELILEHLKQLDAK